ncbi:regulator of intracellular pH; Na+/H+ antiporter [Salmonella enterica subsp. enterica]|uniref:Regulator of intracellular pH Na+/H+ antiporter n=1 Tax=Salmonella enterica I TaxID=59201 RepID=A0A447U1S5_SALET|nr:regulator of intracellular pH; Na+/H+ antiporter [Salmonella enterica subsp. enterica]
MSSISDNVFVGTIYINEAKAAMENGANQLKNSFELLAVAINTGTNLPSVATPNGQAAFLFLLTSALAPLIRLSYGRMVWMALPYTIVLTLIGLLCVEFTLAPATEWMTQARMVSKRFRNVWPGNTPARLRFLPDNYPITHYFISR